MKKHFKLIGRIVSLFIVAALLITSVACGTQTTTKQEESTKPAASDVKADDQKAQDSGTVKIITWTNPPTKAFIEEFNKKFNAKYPNIKVDFHDVPTPQYAQLQQTRMAAKDVDIMALFGFVAPAEDWAVQGGAVKPNWQQFIEAGQLQDITDQPFVKNYNADKIKAASTLNGKVYSVNTGMYGVSGVFYNKEIFEKCGITATPKTYKELIDAAEKIKAKGISPFGIGGKDVWPIVLISNGILSKIIKNDKTFGKKLWDDQMKFTDPAFVETMEKTQKIFSLTEPGFMTVDYNSMPGRFTAGKFAMMVDGTWAAPSVVKAKADMKFGYFPLPGTDDPSQDYLVGKYDLAWTVLSNSPNKEAAYKWLSMFSEKENYSDYVNKVGILPTQDGIELTDAFSKEIAPLTKSFETEIDLFYRERKGLGQYAKVDMGKFLKPAGNIATVKELLEKAQADWDAAKPK